MFAFQLPVGAVLSVSLPTGGGASFAHTGGGRFVSGVPPIILDGVRTGGQGGEVDLPVEWDREFLPAGAEVESVQFAFDTQGTMKAVEEAAAAGDAHAQRLVSLIGDAQKILDARAVVAAAAARKAEQPAAGVEVDPVEQADAAGVGSGA